MVNAQSLVKFGAEKIKNIADRPFCEARLLLAYCLNCSVSDIIVKHDIEIAPTIEKKYMDCIDKRANSMPMAYITGRQEFYGLEFDVTREVLIPRADTETLVEYILEQNPKTLLDICTGSGCICIASAVNKPQLQCTAVDISETALAAAKGNAVKHGIEQRIDFVQADVFEDFILDRKFDMIVSNPPYIQTNDIQTLMPDVKNYEPRLALDGGETGLIFYEKISEIAADYLNDNGLLAFEIGQGQETEVAEMMSRHFINIGTKQDIAGIQRVIYGEFSKKY